MALNQNLAFDLGETWIINHTAYNSDGVTPLGITGATVEFQVKNGSSILIPFSATTVTIPIGTDGKSVITVPPSAQAGLAPGVYSFTVRIILAGGIITDQTYGSIAVSGSAFN